MKACPVCAAESQDNQNNLKQIGLALKNYHEAYGTFPPAFLADANGRPMHSWRVLILPFIDQAPLHAQYKFDEPWDGPNNSRLLTLMPEIYRCPSRTDSLFADGSVRFLSNEKPIVTVKALCTRDGSEKVDDF